MFERYTERAKKTIFFSKYEAGRLGLSEISPEHLLIALARDTELRNRFLKNFSLEKIRAAMGSPCIGQTEKTAPFDLPLSDGTREVLTLAAEEGAKLGSEHIDNEHVLLGLLRGQGGSATQFLQQMQLSADGVRTELASFPLTRLGDTEARLYQRQDKEEEPPQSHQQGSSERRLLFQIGEFLNKGEERNALKLVNDLLRTEGVDRNRLLQMFCPLGMAIARQIADFPLLQHYCEELLTIKPSDIRTLNILADCLNRQGQTEAAMQFAKRCYDLSIGREDVQATRIITMLTKRFPNLGTKHG
jgi:ATP-dependent Clp protease ATP-binding subunit ClpA